LGWLQLAATMTRIRFRAFNVRIALGGILHETSTCVKTRTTIQDLEFDRGIIRGDDVLTRFRNTNVCTGGFIEGAGKYDFEPVPLLRASALELQLENALLLYLVDPDVARQAHGAGVGKLISASLGGKSDPVQGAPVKAEAEVVAISDGQFAYDGPMFSGLTGSMGTSAWLRIGGVSVVVVSAREQPFDSAFARTLGIDCRAMKYIALKSAAHFRAAFEPFAGSIFNVDAAGIHTHIFRNLPFRKRTRRVFPVELSLNS
jgi:microcystin degradation protein MlrC